MVWKGGLLEKCSTMRLFKQSTSLFPGYPGYFFPSIQEANLRFNGWHRNNDKNDNKHHDDKDNSDNKNCNDNDSIVK